MSYGCAPQILRQQLSPPIKAEDTQRSVEKADGMESNEEEDVYSTIASLLVQIGEAGNVKSNSKT